MALAVNLIWFVRYSLTGTNLRLLRSPQMDALLRDEPRGLCVYILLIFLHCSYTRNDIDVIQSTAGLDTAIL